MKLFKILDSKSKRLKQFYKEKEHTVSVHITCHVSDTKDEYKITSHTSHHHVLYKCPCGSTLLLAPIDFMYESDEMTVDNHSIHSNGGIKEILDQIYFCANNGIYG